MAKKSKSNKTVETLQHNEARRKNIPTAEHQSVVDESTKAAIKVAYERRNPDLDPQLVWRGKDMQDWSDLIVHAPPLYIQEKVHPKALIDDLQRETKEREHDAGELTPDLFSDFNGIPKGADKTEFYQHDQNWSNRMILGDSLQVMASLAEREGLRGKVQCIYFDPPYGIKFNSNFQWSTTSRDVKDGKAEHITREPEQVKAFRDTWRDGIHSYLTYLRDRLTIARDVLHESGSIFVQIGDENLHRVRGVIDEVFGAENFVALITVAKTTGQSDESISSVADYVVWTAKQKPSLKARRILKEKELGGEGASKYKSVQMQSGVRLPLSRVLSSNGEVPDNCRPYRLGDITSTRPPGEGDTARFTFNGREFTPGKRTFTTDMSGLRRLALANRVEASKKTLSYVRFLDDFPAVPATNIWTDIGGVQSRADPKVYVVQSAVGLVSRCVLLSTDPGDLVLDPTCGSGTSAMVSEQLGRRWITIDTSRVALTLARSRIMGARFPYYLLADSDEGRLKQAALTHTTPSEMPANRNIRHGFVYERVPHITLKSIANNAEIDVIWERFEEDMLPLREQLTEQLPSGWLADYRKKQKYTAEVPDAIQEWEVPRDFPDTWPEPAKALHEKFWDLRITRQKEIDASIAAKADHEYLYDKPYEDKTKVRVAGPFTVESISPHRVLGVDENDELIDQVAEEAEAFGRDFTSIILENLKTAGVQQAHKQDKIEFASLEPWPGDLICAEGTYHEGGEGLDHSEGKQRRAAIFIGPEFGTVSRADLVEAAREAGDANFDVLIACAFNYEAHASEFEKLGRIPVLKARMNADLHMADDLKNTGKGNLFVIFGEPEIEITEADNDCIQVQVKGVDVFDPSTGEVRSDGPDGIACWFIDTDYNMESFFVRHAYFLGANDPYKALKTTLKAEIDQEAWETLNSDTSRPFEKPKSGRIAVKVINHLGDEVMKVFRV